MVQVTFRTNEELRSRFMTAVRERNRDAREVFEEFMRNYVSMEPNTEETEELSDRQFHGQDSPTVASLRSVAQTLNSAVLRLNKIVQPLQHLPLLFDNLPGEVCIKNAHSEIVWCNEKFCNLVKRPQNALLGLRPKDIWPAERAVRIRQLDLLVFEYGEPFWHHDVIPAEGNASSRSRLGLRYPFSARPPAEWIAVIGFDFEPKLAREVVEAFQRIWKWDEKMPPNALKVLSDTSNSRG